MRVLVTGAGGMVGTVLAGDLCAGQYEVIPVDVADVAGLVRADLRDCGVVARLLEEYRPDAIVHLAANKNVVFCEENVAAARQINFGITDNLVKACKSSRTRLIFFSTDYVFGKEDRVWKETDEPCPTTQYGRDKAASERLIRDQLADYVIVRSAGLYGMADDFIQVVRKALSRGDEFGAFDNLVNCPTWTLDLFQMVDVILKRQLTGIFHCVGPESMSRYEYARCVALAYGLDARLVKPLALDFTKDVRPPVLRLDGTATYKTLGVVPGTLEQNLRKM